MLFYRIFPAIAAGCAALMDIQRAKVDNGWLLFCVLVSLFTHIWKMDVSSLETWICGLLVPILILGILFIFRMLGAGDIKLFMALSCMTDYSIVLHTIIFSLCLAAVYGLFRLIRQGTLLQRILYFRTYMQSSLVKKQWVPYREQSGMDDSCMHLAPAVLGGYLLTLGVV